MTAPTPPAKMIDEGKVIFKKVDEHEAKRIEIYPSLSAGAVEFAQKYVNIFGSKQIKFSCSTLVEWINILCTIPTEIDKRHFVSIQHAWDQEHTQWQPLPLPWFTFKKIDVELVQQVRKLYLLSLPFLKVEKQVNRWKLKLFDYIQLVKYKRKTDKKTLYLFGIPIFIVKTKKNNIILFLFKILPILSIKRK